MDLDRDFGTPKLRIQCESGSETPGFIIGIASMLTVPITSFTDKQFFNASQEEGGDIL